MVVGTQIVYKTPSLLRVLGSAPGPDEDGSAETLIAGSVTVVVAAKAPPTEMMRPPWSTGFKVVEEEIATTEPGP
jgi:hypothetical protein